MTDGTTPAPAVAFLTLGCPKNEVDTDKMRGAVATSAYRLVEDHDQADIVIVNTCSFITEATEESISVVLELASEWLPHSDSRKLVVAGCMPSRYGGDLASEVPEVAAFVPVDREGAVLEVLEQVTGVPSRPQSTAAANDQSARVRTVNGPSAYLQVSDGCHRDCAYCTIPSIRGPYRSRPLDDIVAEAAELVAAGAKEIVLIGQDITAYGRDLATTDTIADVVRAVAAVPDVHWLRLMYAQPDGVTDELLEAMATNANVCEYLDMPLQHASKRVLRAMKRSGDAQKYLALVARIRDAIPDAVLRTTLIAGFPGETRSDVNEVQRFLEDAGFDYVGVFPYSREQGTSAAAMEPQVPLRTRRARAQRLRDLADRIGFEKAAAHVGRVVDVLVEGVDEDTGMVVGRWSGQAPDIDGVVWLDRGEPGEIVSARIVDSICYDLEGEVVT